MAPERMFVPDDTALEVLRLIDGARDVDAIVDDLAVRFERDVAAADPSHGIWRFDFERPEERVQLKGIVGFRLRPAQVALKFKLNQNHPEANQASVATHLERGDETQRAVAALMRARLLPGQSP